MLDQRLRPTKQRMLRPLVATMVGVPPGLVTATGVGLGLAAAVAAAVDIWLVALVLFGLSRLADGIDGDLARVRGLASDQGGYTDIVADTVVYAALPLGLAVGSDADHIWPITAALLGSFYLNTITWTYLAAVLEKRGGAEGAIQPRVTSTVMPMGLIEGTETMAFFVAIVLLPDLADLLMIAMAALVTVGAMVRFHQGRRLLRPAEPAEHQQIQ